MNKYPTNEIVSSNEVVPMDDNSPSEDQPTEYKLNVDDIKILTNQVSITDVQACCLLEKHKGDIVLCVLDVYDYHDDSKNNKTENETENENNENNNNTNDNTTENQLSRFREILDEKEKIFNKMINSNSNNSSKNSSKNSSNNNQNNDHTLENIIYIGFDFDTKSPFKPQKVRAERNYFTRNIVLKYLESNFYNKYDKETPSQQNKGLYQKIITRVVQKKGNKISQKWGLTKAVIMYLPEQIKNKSDIENTQDNDSIFYRNIINKFATRFLFRCSHLKEDQVLCGPCVVVNNWV